MTTMEGGEMIFGGEGDSISDGPQTLIVKVQDAGAGKFFVIETERWAFDTIEELTALLDQVKVAFKVGKENEPDQKKVA